MNKLIKDYEKHFLFNSLNVIKYFCRVDNEKASELIAVFARLLNYMVFDKRRYISVIEEFELLYYIKSIQEIRFSNKIILIKEEKESKDIPKGIIISIFLLGYNLNILKCNGAKIKIELKDKLIKIKMTSNLELNLKEIKSNEFFKSIYQDVKNSNYSLNLSLKENKLSFDVFL